jgi:SAM-dependent methyltransferase
MIERWLAYPLTRGLDLDDPHTTELRRQVLRGKPFLHRLYCEWYSAIAGALPPRPGGVLELGSGAGFLKEWIPGLITSETFYCAGIDAVLDGQELPIADCALRAVVMTDVLHHIPKVRRFLREAARCVRPGGRVVMIEPWVSAWSRVVYTRFHHEPFQPAAAEWEFPAVGPLSGANGALPWIVFERDRAQFEREFPEWKLALVRPMMPFRYLLSGGISLRSLMPACTFGLWRGVEGLLSRWMSRIAMFVQIVLERRELATTQGGERIRRLRLGSSNA